MPLLDAEFFWLVGLWEGEGSFGTNGKSRSPLMRIGMTDIDTMKKVESLMPGGYWYRKPKQKAHHKDMLYYHLTGQAAYLWMLKMKHYMSVRRSTRIGQILQEYNSIEDRRPLATQAAVSALGGR
jgi:hypothetical protein